MGRLEIAFFRACSKPGDQIVPKSPLTNEPVVARPHSLHGKALSGSNVVALPQGRGQSDLTFARDDGLPGSCWSTLPITPHVRVADTQFLRRRMLPNPPAR